ncbi:MAG: hypothetical protein C4293_01810, partial [Nitrospiraceae bacterium]
MIKPIRLCFVGPANNITLRRWVEWFSLRGHESTVLTVEPVEDCIACRFNQVSLGVPYGPRKLGRLVSAARAALTIRWLKPDVLHAHYLRGLAWGLPLSGHHPFVVTPWGSDVLEEQGAFIERYSKVLTRWVLNSADLVTVHSNYMKTRVCPLLRSDTRVMRIGWGVDLRQFRPGLDVRSIRERWQIAKDQRVIFSPRLAQPFYQHDLIVKALPVIREKVPKVLLVIAEQFADPVYVDYLRRLAQDLRVDDHLRLVGCIPYSIMPYWFNLADAVVMLPRSDGMPNSLLEAMACGAVPILNKLPQYTELIHDGMNGFLVDANRDLARVLIYVLSDSSMKNGIMVKNRTLVMEMADQDREMLKMEFLYSDLAAHAS